MNRIHITTPLDDNQQPTGPHPVEMTLSTVAQQSAWGESLLAAFEVEILQGFSFAQDEDSTTYCFEVNDEKAAQLKQVLTLAFFPPPIN
ncbi:hypothetical protein [Hymenobacter cellulosivorans]|uniref:Uncharacterized protein n=1 Tax=Hymenobacter cellulosivorans TaxID=2932249 RepID=A0ABY4FAN7_9BACT|nr:hypothetical protein [Hymenobacter cellulosivorans]UOQ53073.1 hypothetical protein MUN80_25465 [Hymenobacter cellulosivorans]